MVRSVLGLSVRRNPEAEGGDTLMTDTLNQLFTKAYLRLHDERGMEALTIIAIAVVMIPLVIVVFKLIGFNLQTMAQNLIDQITKAGN